MTRISAAILVVVLAGCRENSPAATAGQPSNPTRGTSPVAKENDVPVTGLRLELLKSAQTQVEPTERNPRPAASGRGAPVVIAPPPGPVGPPLPPPITLKYIGVLDTTEGKVAVFRETGGDIVNGKEGDIIDGRYRLLKIGVESADLAYVDGRGRQTIRLSGQ
jgi:hypothetical protein